MENIEKKMGFPEEFLNKEQSTLVNLQKSSNNCDNFETIYFENDPLGFSFFDNDHLQTQSIENIEKYSGFPEELLSKEESKLVNLQKSNNNYDNFEAIYFENGPLGFFLF